jgi:DNA-binding transcriptional MerR regulator
MKKGYLIAKVITNNKEEKDIEVDCKSLLKSIDASIGNTSPENIIGLDIKFVSSFRVGDCGVSSKNLLHWKNCGVLLNYTPNESGWTKFNLYELIWLQIVKELRVIGISLEMIKKIKQELILPNDLHELAEQAYSIEKLKAEYETESMETITSMSNLFSFIDTIKHFSNALSECIIEKINIQLIVFLDGDAYFYWDEEKVLFKRYDYEGNRERYDITKTISNEVMRFKSHVAISITELLKNYVISEKNLLRVQDIGIINENERELLELIRRHDIQQITIIYQGEKPNIVEITENQKTVDLESRYCDHILKKGHQDITYQTVNGKLVSFKRTTKIKLQ